jgi:hypothetical protein
MKTDLKMLKCSIKSTIGDVKISTKFTELFNNQRHMYMTCRQAVFVSSYALLEFG